jgi:hypothetical protein
MDTKDMKPADFYKEDGTFDWASFWKQQADRANEHVAFLSEQVQFFLKQKTADKTKPWAGLTHEEQKEIYDSMPYGSRGLLTHWGYQQLINAVEEKLKNKNT